MTDKEIIIDINKCKYKDTHTNFCKAEKNDIGECYTICTGNDCYYKQLKRKEQEYNKLYIQLKVDEEYHREEENTLRKIIKNKEERNIDLYKENKKLKQTITEIKEITSKVLLNITT